MNAEIAWNARKEKNEKKQKNQRMPGAMYSKMAGNAKMQRLQRWETMQKSKECN